MSRFAVILAAAGRSERFGDPFTKKVYTRLSDRPIWMHSAEAFSKRSDVEQLILVIAPEDRELFKEKFAGNAAMLGMQVVVGGQQRAESVKNGLDAVRDGMDFVAVHDAARPCVAQPWLEQVFERARQAGAAILAQPCHATLKRVGPEKQVSETLSRENVWLAQTPQVCRTDWLREAYAQASDLSGITDESGLLEAAGRPVAVVAGSPLNIKVTTKADLKFAELALKALPKPNPFPFD